MPTYDYECRECEHLFEEFQSITAKPLRRCPECGKNKLRRLIGAGAGVIFKGSGFYETDYRSEGYKNSAKAEKDAASPKSDSTKETKADKSDSAGKEKTKTKPSPKAGESSKP